MGGFVYIYLFPRRLWLSICVSAWKVAVPCYSSKRIFFTFPRANVPHDLVWSRDLVARHFSGRRSRPQNISIHSLHCCSQGSWVCCSLSQLTLGGVCPGLVANNKQMHHWNIMCVRHTERSCIGTWYPYQWVLKKWCLGNVLVAANARHSPLKPKRPGHVGPKSKLLLPDILLLCLLVRHVESFVFKGSAIVMTLQVGIYVDHLWSSCILAAPTHNHQRYEQNFSMLTSYASM